jgi:hypothetical protein
MWPEEAQNHNLSHSKDNFLSTSSFSFRPFTLFYLQHHCAFNTATNENGCQSYMVQEEDNDTEGEEEGV